MDCVFEEIESVEEYRSRLEDVATALNHPERTSSENHVDDSPYRWYVDPAWGDDGMAQLDDQNWLLIAELLDRCRRDPHLAGLVGDARSRALTLSRWALARVVRDGDARTLVNREWRERYAPRKDEYWFFTYPSNASSDEPVADRFRWARGTAILRNSIDTRDAKWPDHGPFRQDYLLVAGVLLEYFYHPVLLTAYCSPVWRALELSACFVGAAGAEAGDLREMRDDEWYRLTHPGRPPWERMADPTRE